MILFALVLFIKLCDSESDGTITDLNNYVEVSIPSVSDKFYYFEDDEKTNDKEKSTAFNKFNNKFKRKDFYLNEDVMKNMDRTKSRNWLLSTSAMLCISVLGLLAVLSVPIMQRFFLDKIINFLVALAVACLTGDALLHLLPHALEVVHNETKEDTNIHRTTTFKALCAVAGLYLFLISERVGKRSSIWKMSRTRPRIRNVSICEIPDDQDATQSAGLLTDDSSDDPPYRHSDCDLPINHHISYHHHHHHHSHDLFDDHSNTPNKGVAYMLVIGDALHNFADGLAIGASFSNNITAGICTAIAVVCHELPHEIGLFAVLLKLGISIKQAVGFNCLSSVMSILGSLLGLYVGQSWNIAPYIYAIIAGIFIYLALVDMLPQLTIDPNSLLGGFFLENLGFACGLAIMSIIAIYESELNKWISNE